MSGNYVFYATKIAQMRAARSMSRSLRGELDEILRFVATCEARWRRIERIDGQPPIAETSGRQ